MSKHDASLRINHRAKQREDARIHSLKKIRTNGFSFLLPRHGICLFFKASTPVDGDFKSLAIAVGINRKRCRQTDQTAGGAAAHVQAYSPGKAKGRCG